MSQTEQHASTDAQPDSAVAESACVFRPRAWVFKPNCSLTPRQLAVLYLSLVIVTLSIAAGFCAFGMWLVLPFAGIELLVVGIAFLVYARHAGDYEEIVIEGRELNVAVMHGSRLSTFRFNPGWTKVSLPGAGQLLRLESGSVQVAVGRFVTAQVRERLVYELRRALAAAAA